MTSTPRTNDIFGRDAGALATAYVNMTSKRSGRFRRLREILSCPWHPVPCRNIERFLAGIYDQSSGHLCRGAPQWASEKFVARNRQRFSVTGGSRIEA